ncbi:MAG TPA: hypothetical protein PLG25_11670, partial [bacterium]|nr:hypothetical protein [bacterium]
LPLELGSAGTFLKLDGSNGPMTGLFDLAGNAVNPLNAVTLQQFNLGLVGLTPKGSVQAASDANINLASPASALVDGHTLLNGDRFLAQTQTNPIENGIYIFMIDGNAQYESQLLGRRDAIGIHPAGDCNLIIRQPSHILLIEVPMNF